MIRSLSAGVSAALLAGCSGGGTAAIPAPALVGAVTVAPNPHPAVPLAAVVHLETASPCRVELGVDDGEQQWTVRDDALVAGPREIPLLGLAPGRTHRIDVVLRDAAGTGRRVGDRLSFASPGLPADFPPIVVTATTPARTSPGGTVLGIVDRVGGDKLVMLDAEGRVVWYLDDRIVPWTGVRPNLLLLGRDGDDFVVNVDRRGLVVVSALGEVKEAYWATNVAAPPVDGFYTPVPVDSFHHDAIRLPGAAGVAFAALGTEARRFADYPASEVDPSSSGGAAEVVGDTIVEFSPDGGVLREIRLLDLLDPFRLCYDSLGNYWDDHYRRPTRDWSHANALVYDPEQDAYVVSLRHQDALVAIDRAAGTVRWILGPHERWAAPWQGLLLAPMPGLEWQFHQHAPERTADGGFLMFDNGTGRAVPPATRLSFAESWSRAVEFRVDEATRTVAETWAYGSPPDRGEASFYSFFVGDANRLANGDVLVCDGGKLEPAPRFNLYGRVAEVTHTDPAELLFEAWVQDRAPGTNPRSYFVYRALRVPALHP